MDYGSAIIALASVALGYVGTLLTEARRDRRLARQEFRMSQTEFRRQQLLELQDVLAVMYTADRHRFAEQVRHYQATNVFPVVATPSPWQERWDVALARAGVLRSHLRDDRLLELLDYWDAKGSELARSSTFEDARSALDLEGAALRLVHDRISEIIHGLDHTTLDALSASPGWLQVIMGRHGSMAKQKPPHD